MNDTIKRPKANIVRPKANTVEPSQVAMGNNTGGFSGGNSSVSLVGLAKDAAKGYPNYANRADTIKKLQAEGLGTGGLTQGGGTASVKNGGVSGAANQGSSLLPVRQALESAGLDPSKIGWANGQVTYGGRAFSPNENRNGTTYTTKDKLDSFIKGIQEDIGNLGVRDTFLKLGLNPNKIGWDNGYVTYNGLRFEPSVNANGTTYSPAKDVYAWANDALKTQGDSLALVSEYMPANGLYDVGWNDETKEVLIGGRSLPYAYIDENGRAVAKASDIEALYDNIGRERGIISPQEMFNEWLESQNAINAAIDEIKDREFNYNVESDPAYLAYKAMYEREGKRAYEDMLARAAARTGGNMSSMARAQANQQYDYYMQRLADVIPQLYQMAYERFSDDQTRDLNAISSQANLNQDMFTNRGSINELAWNRFLEQENLKKQRGYDDLEYEVFKSNANNAILEDAYNASQKLDTPISADIAYMYGISPNADGTYPTANEIVIRQQNALWEGYEKGIYDYQQAVEMQKYIDQMAIDLGADKALADYKASIERGNAAYKAGLDRGTAAYKASLKTNPLEDD